MQLDVWDVARLLVWLAVLGAVVLLAGGIIGHVQSQVRATAQGGDRL